MTFARSDRAPRAPLQPHAFRRLSGLLLMLLALPVLAGAASLPPLPTDAEIDAQMQAAMDATGARGLALAVIDQGKVVSVLTHGDRNAAGDPLRGNSIMYGASLTKAAFAYMVMQLVDEGLIDLDRSIADYLPKPLPSYGHPAGFAPWQDLADEPRWRNLTPRILLSHAAGFANYAFLEPDGKLRTHFEPGSHYAYSGEGYILLQFVLQEGLGLDVGAEMQRRVFQRLEMADTSMVWRDDFADRLADGWTAEGKAIAHDARSRVRASGSMDSSIADIARLVAGHVRGDGMGMAAHAEMLRPWLPISTATQFPTLQVALPLEQRRADLGAALGVIIFDGPLGPGYMKGGHDDSTGNTWVCLQQGRRCVVILSNDVRAEPTFPALVRSVLGSSGAPWEWEYGAMKFWSEEGRTD